MRLFDNTQNLSSAMAYTTSNGDKVYPIIVDIKRGIQGSEEISFVSSDVRTGVISVALMNNNVPYNVHGCKVLCTVLRPDASTFEVECECIQSNIIEIELGTLGTRLDGIYSFDIKIQISETKTIGTPQMSYSVAQSLDMDETILEDDRVPVLATLITQTEQAVDTANQSLDRVVSLESEMQGIIQEGRETVDEVNVTLSNVNTALGEVDGAIVRLDNAVSKGEQDIADAIASIPSKEELKGEQGIQGIQGEKGEKGDTGEQGIQGIQGEKGDKGDKGDTGAKGEKGDKGDKGEDGLTVSVSVNGETYQHQNGIITLPDYPSSETFAEEFSRIDGKIEENKTSITSIETELSKTENTKYTTANGIKEFSCKDGYVDNVVIEGETLVNLNTFNAKGYDGNRIWLYDFNSSLCTNNTQYTIFNTNDKIITIQYTLNGNWVDGAFVHLQPNTSQLVTVSNNYQFGGIFGAVMHGWANNDDSYAELKQSIIILEGDYTNKPISYFEGLKSVGQGDKIEVLTRYEEGNLFNNEYRNGSYLDDGSFYSGNNGTSNTELLYVKPNTKYSISYDNSDASAIFEFDVNKRFIKRTSSSNSFSFTTTSNTRYINFFIGTNSQGFNPLIKTIISEGDIAPYQPSQQDKKQISTTLRSLPNGVKDTIEKRGNKYVKVQRCGEVVLNGSEIDFTIAKNSANYTYARIGVSDMANTVINLYCDKFSPNDTSSFEREMVFGEGQSSIGRYIYINILNSRLASQSVEGFKTWLKENPVTVVYELATPIVTELPNFNPQTFEDNTTLLINSGVIQAEAEFEVTNSMGSEIEVLKDKVSDNDEVILTNKEQIHNLYGDLLGKLSHKNLVYTYPGKYFSHIIDEKDLDNIRYNLMCYTAGTDNLLNLPTGESGAYGVLEVKQLFYNSGIHHTIQIFYNTVTGAEYKRYYNKDKTNWSSWQKINTISTLSLLEQQVSELETQSIENEKKISILENENLLLKKSLKLVLAGDMYSLAKVLYPEDFEGVYELK